MPSETPNSVEQRITEAAARLPRGGAVTGWAALRMAGSGLLDGVAPDGMTLLPVPLAVPRGVNLRAVPGTTVSRGQFLEEDLVVHHGVPCTRPAVAAYDEVRRSVGLREAVVALDMALAAGLCTKEQYAALVKHRRGWPGRDHLLAAAAYSDERSRSPGETRMRLVWVIDAGLPRPRCNWPVADGHGARLGRPDLLCEELGVVGEYEGADHRTARQQAHDVERDERYRHAGLTVVQAVGRDVLDPPRLARRMRAAVTRAASDARPRGWTVARDPGPL